jgi:transcriptional regulator GlxA family with amidase domain
MRWIEFFLYPDATGLDIVGPLDVFTAANWILSQKGSGQKGYHVLFSAKKTGLIRLNSGLQIYADIAIGKGDSIDIFLVPGSLDTNQVTQDFKLINQIGMRAKSAKQIVSICGGAFILAACGLLKGKNVTTHWSAADDLARKYPDIKVTPDAIYIRDDNIYSSAGVTAGIDLALALVEEHHGSQLAIDVARILVLYLRRPGRQSQFSAPMKLRAKAGKKFSKLHDWILENLKQSLCVESLAEYVAMSPRNFSRIFSKTTGMSPGKYVESIRLEHARELLESGNSSVETVAKESGFMREERLRRVFLRQLGITPSQYRFHFKQN